MGVGGEHGLGGEVESGEGHTPQQAQWQECPEAAGDRIAEGAEDGGADGQGAGGTITASCVEAGDPAI
ncbi:hypothetical protein ACP3WA_25595, partial [Salmonella enterica]|uniref:hypothetical protein n=1 Tax=Salmonella enterica TaxID=28901 RepID=UPI003CEE5651